MFGAGMDGQEALQAAQRASGAGRWRRLCQEAGPGECDGPSLQMRDAFLPILAQELPRAH
jgi:hypothetical protein